MKVTTHFHQVPNLKMSGAIPLLPPCLHRVHIGTVTLTCNAYMIQLQHSSWILLAYLISTTNTISLPWIMYNRPNKM